MRVDSCRKCGMELTIKQECSICNEPNKFNCKECYFEPEEQIHSLCRLVDMNHNPLISETA
ncbi:hypothetical protein [Candidatus Nitrosopumilus sediminis]|uniref:Uncharacterized protein n=1 Tax=Candidatus Nitrosopumilus sediminis TaxID=1229909 RepID=K0BAV4_9ARCH|nr:hypothetical protein [Candidatus Nitrosopumilus sediminis]AFS82217.1 hypothetical protein NSED_02035 [Candidatus Nitrosopumilus sediminis]